MDTELKPVLIVDENPILREAIRRRLRHHSLMKCCGDTCDISGALEMAKKLKPALIVLDLDVGGGQGINLVRRLTSGEGPKVLVYSKYKEELYAERALHAGANGFIDKRCSADELLEAMVTVLEGKMHLSTLIADRMLRRLVGRRSASASQHPIESLSDREREVFGLIGTGRTTRQIGEHLGLSLHTIHTHRENIKHKLGCTTSAELVRNAVQWAVEQSQSPTES